MARPTLSNGIPPRLVQYATYTCLALGGLCWITYSGPYRWLAELQMSWFDAYYAMYTWIGTSLLLLVPALAALQAARVAGLVTTVADSRAQLTESTARFQERFQHYRWPFIVLVLGATLLFMGGRDYLRARGGQELETVGIEALENGVRPRSTWVELTGGTPVWDAMVTWKKDHTETLYVPVLSEGWKQGASASAVLMLKDYELADARKASVFRGATYELGMPGAVRAAYADVGFPAAQALVLVLNVKPADNEQDGLMFACIGLALLAVALGLFMWRLRAELQR